ncbi:SMC5 [Candida pseudojiufengensis]|uniref:SMC5 n=1 Tax=Candida pseudojiufengensis TaxID=497109 RepID=UPI0022243DE1|nr:SMC5 [Candida pseudojiufengensis]KAI5963678.1 SMC5 [Candida pseudojiufengensis]
MNGDSTQQISKRRRVREPVPFQPGFLRKIRVWNFTTYSYTEFVLSPTLNMIIGPNGSGKSTLVAAICLGLAGNIKLIKRNNLKSMIKTGHERAVIEITIENIEGEPPVTIKREFTAKNSTWSMNGRECTETAVKNLRLKFNIQLDNLCHFLPQERVAEFAGLSPEKLLIETERTLGDGHLLALHEDLILEDKNSQELTRKISELKQKLEQLQGDKGKLEEEARKFEAYEKKADEIEKHRSLIPFAIFNDIKNQRANLKEQRDQAKLRLRSFDKNFDPLRHDLKNVEEAIKEQKGIKLTIRQDRDAIQSKIEELRNKIINKQDEIIKLLESVKSYRTRAEQKKKELELVKEELTKLKSQREGMNECDQSQLDVLNDKYKEKRGESRQLEESLSDRQQKMTELKSDIGESDHKVRNLERKLQGTDKLELLISEAQRGNRYKLRDDSYKNHSKLRTIEQFHGQYFEAPVISCNVKDRSIAAVVEKVIDNNSLFAVTVTNDRSLRMMNDFLKKTQTNMPIRQFSSSNIPRSEYSNEQLKSFGFEGYVIDQIKGPAEVLSMLCGISKLHAIPYSRSALTSDQLDRLRSPRNGGIRFKKFIAGDTLFNVKQSSYGSKQIFYVAEDIGRASFFNISGISEDDKANYTNQIKKLKADMEEKREEYQSHKTEASNLHNSIQNLKSEMNDFKDQQRQLHESIKAIAALETRITSRTEKIERLERESSKDYSQRIKQYEQKVLEEYNNSSELSTEMGELFEQYSNCQIKGNFIDLKIMMLENRKKSAEDLILELQSMENELREDFQRYKDQYDKIKDSAEYREYKERNDALSLEEKETLRELATPFTETGTFTEKTIRTKISHLEDELSLLSTADKNSIDALKKKLEDIKIVETDLPIFEQQKANLDTRIAGLLTTWESELSESVRQISLSFSKRFSKVASEGRVELYKSDRFKDWKLQILVKFRQESELKVLDNQSQSGGERAVSTIFFIMSLQGLTDAPFRIVDEINQGMDPKNEQMAHRYLVHTACENNKSQYFLVTPKLLTGLYYHPDMVVHCIFTGPLIEENDDKKKEGFLDFVQKLVSV